MIKRIHLGIFIILMVQHFVKAQQQQMYTQFMYNKMGLNAAYAGNETYLSATLIYRDQWSGFPGAPKAQTFSVNLPRIANRIGIGFNIERQSLGITEKLTYEMMYAYKFFLGEGTLSMGMNVSGRKFVQDFTDSRLFAIQDIQLDPSIPALQQTRNLLNAGFGVYFNTNKFYLGASLPRMIRTDLDFDNNNLFSTEVRHLLLMTGGTFVLNNDVRLTPQMMFRIAEYSPWNLDMNLSSTWKDKYSLGLTYRTGGIKGAPGESIDLIAGLQISERMMFGVAYDIPLSPLRTIDTGSLELILSYNLIPRKVKTIVINPRYF